MAAKKFKVTYGVDQRVEEEDNNVCLQTERLIRESLCANCKHQGDCIFLSKTCTPILECELYECGPSEKPRLVVVKKYGASADDHPDSEGALLGLCMNCENQKGCSLPKPASGVWMCEEYC